MHTKFERLLSKSLTTLEVMTYYLVVHTGPGHVHVHSALAISNFCLPDYAHLKKEAEEAGQVADSGSLADAASKTVETTHVVLPILGVVLVTVLAVFYLAKKRGWRLPGLKQAADLVAGGTNDRGNAAAQQDNRNDDQLPPPQQVDEAHERLLYDGPQQQQQQQDGQQQQEQQQGQQQQQPPPQTAISARHPVEEMGGAT